MIFDEDTLRKLEQLTLVADQVRVGVMKGDRRSRKRGSSVEFADYRNYTRGDDLRRLDWNVFARLERPFIKLLEEEEDLAVHLLVDASGSMDWPRDVSRATQASAPRPPAAPASGSRKSTGTPRSPVAHASSLRKLTYALRLAGALGHVALSGGDRLNATLLTTSGDGLQRWGPFRGAQNSMRLFQFLENAAASGPAAGVTNLDVSLRAYALRGGRPGLLFLLSDMLSPTYRDGLSALQSRGYELVLLHILSPDEQQPPFDGDLKLIDVESGAQADISVDATTLAAYRERLRAWQEEIASFCSRRGAHYVPVVTDMPWERLVLQTFRRRGIVT